MRKTIYLFWCGLCLSGSLPAQDLEGVLEWQHPVELGTLVDGVVNRVNVKVGERVARGTLLVELDQRENQARQAWAEAWRAAAQQQQAEARRELDRSLELYDRTLLSDHERKQAEIEAARADARFREADAVLVGIRLQREYSKVTAPFDGVVVAVYTYPGQALVNHLQITPLITLADPATLKVVARVDAEHAASLKVGGKVQVGFDGDWLPGRISSIGLKPPADSHGGGYRLEVTLDAGPKKPLKADQRVVVRVDG